MGSSADRTIERWPALPLEFLQTTYEAAARLAACDGAALERSFGDQGS